MLNGRGQIAEAVLGPQGTVEILTVEQAARPQPELVLLLGALKQAAWEEVLKHATELGVTRVVRVESAHAVSRLEGKVEKKMTRWRDLLVEACKQSSNPWLPELELRSSVQEACEQEETGSALVAQMEGDPLPFPQAVQTLPAGRILIWVGPEGDFTSGELRRIRNTGALPVSLGPRILRAETAAIGLLSCLRLGQGDGLH